jgi:hypothetical protein
MNNVSTLHGEGKIHVRKRVDESGPFHFFDALSKLLLAWAFITTDLID